jgi:hypothetical protein
MYFSYFAGQQYRLGWEALHWNLFGIEYFVFRKLKPYNLVESW